eukprot:1546912-Pleurochrysis_carterae.AAC.1
MSDRASRWRASAPGCGPVHNACRVAAVCLELDLSSQRVKSFRPCSKSLFSTALVTCSAVPPEMTKAPRMTISAMLPSSRSP